MSQSNRPSPAAWGAVPVVPVALAVVAGVLLGNLTLGRPAWPWLLLFGFALIGTLLTVVLRRTTRWWARGGSLLVLVAAFGLAGWRTVATHLPNQANYFLHQVTDDALFGGRIRVIKPSGDRLRAEVSLQEIFTDSSSAPVVGNLLVYLTPDEAAAELRAGDRLVFSGRPKAIGPPLNPGAFNRQSYWARQRTYHSVRLDGPVDWRLAGASDPGLRARADDLRRAWFKRLRQHLSGDELAVATALVLGKRDLLTSEIQSAYADTGAVHVLAVSGLHVGIIFVLINLVLVKLLKLDRFRFGRFVVVVLGVGLIWAFALVSGLSPSVQRAALMFSVVQTGRLWQRPTHVFNTLATAGVVMVLLDPNQLLQVGFQLSFAAIVGIVSFSAVIERSVYWPFGGLRKAWSAVAVSTGAQLGTLPFSLAYFGQFPTYFWASGTLVIATAFAIMGGGVALGLLGGVPVVGTIIGNFLGLLVELQNAVVFWFRQLPWALLETGKLTVAPVLCLAAGILLLAVYAHWRRRWTLLVSLGLLLASFVWARAQVPGADETAVVVYHVFKQTTIDVVHPASQLTIGSQPATTDLFFTAGPHRRQRGYDPTLTLPLSADTTLSEDLMFSAGSWRIHGTEWVVIDGRADGLPLPITASTDYVLLANAPLPADFPNLPPGSDPLLILDGSTPPWKIDDWRALAAERNLRLHVTGTDGAFLLTLRGS